MMNESHQMLVYYSYSDGTVTRKKTTHPGQRLLTVCIYVHTKHSTHMPVLRQLVEGGSPLLPWGTVWIQAPIPAEPPVWHDTWTGHTDQASLFKP